MTSQTAPVKTCKQVEAFDPPCVHPNGLQWTEDGLWVMDQLTDKVFLVDETGKLLRELETPTDNGSGITVGGGYLWTASNGRTAARSFRSTDTHLGYIYQLDMETGEEHWLAYPIQRDDQESLATMDVLPGYSFTPDSRCIRFVPWARERSVRSRRRAVDGRCTFTLPSSSRRWPTPGSWTSIPK